MNITARNIFKSAVVLAVATVCSVGVASAGGTLSNCPIPCWSYKELVKVDVCYEAEAFGDLKTCDVYGFYNFVTGEKVVVCSAPKSCEVRGSELP